MCLSLQIHKVRAALVETLKKEFADYNLTYSIGGQISFDMLYVPPLYVLFAAAHSPLTRSVAPMDGTRRTHFATSSRKGSKRFISLATRRTRAETTMRSSPTRGRSVMPFTARTIRFASSRRCLICRRRIDCDGIRNNILHTERERGSVPAGECAAVQAQDRAFTRFDFPSLSPSSLLPPISLSFPTKKFVHLAVLLRLAPLLTPIRQPPAPVSPSTPFETARVETRPKMSSKFLFTCTPASSSLTTCPC
jgi:hypothetical protein